MYMGWHFSNIIMNIYKVGMNYWDSIVHIDFHYVVYNKTLEYVTSYVLESNSSACNIYKQIRMLELGSLQLGQ